MCPERPSFKRLVAMIRTRLDEDTYEVAFADARAMPMEQGIELALELAADIQASSPCPPAPPGRHTRPRQGRATPRGRAHHHV